jgi:ADP-ribosylglycohydrolase family protein
MDPRFSRAYGALAGLALGDALGMPTQEMSPEQIRAVYGRITGLVDGDASQPYAPGMPAGSVTDDTEQALLVASLLVRGRGSSSGRVALDAGEFAHALLAWEDSMIERGSLDLLGPSTKAALARVRAGEDPLSVGGAGTTNGAAMRVTPIGIAMSTADPEAFADAIWSSCQVTHATRQGFQSAALVAAAVSMGIDTARSTAPDLRGLLWKAVTYVDSLPERGAWTPDPDVVAATRRAMQLVANPASSSLECLVEQVGTSVASAQAIPMAFALLARDPSPQALLDAANIGGDTDTIGAIAGAILGAALGFEVFVGRGLAQVELASHLDLPSVALELLELRAAHEPAASAPTSPETEGASEADVPEVSSPASSSDPGAGRVVLMGQILVDRVLQGARPIHGGGSEWARDGGTHVGGGFNALVAARRMGAEAISLSPIGTGPHASMIEAALAREGIVDAGPRVDGVDNGFCVAMIGHDAERTFISTKGAETMTPETAWADFVRTMSPGDVLYIDGYLMDHPANREAAEAALRVLPEGVRVLLDVSPVIGIPESLPTHHAIISMNSVEARAIAKQSRLDGYLPFDSLSCRLAQTLGRDTLIRLGASGAYFARSVGPDSKTSAAQIPTPTVDAVDTNGAGDAHTGVLAASLALGIPLERGLVLANCAGALASTVPGPASCPTREDIEAAADALSESGN